MEKLKRMKECLEDVVEQQIHGNIEKVDAKELGEAVDMIKDLAEAIYYCTITDAMEEGSAEMHHETMYYKRPMPMYAKRHPEDGKVHYPESVWGVYRDGAMRDPHEGKSGIHRKMYMDGKGMKDKNKQMQELESYMNELAQDMSEMINDASPEEKQLMQNKLLTLSSKIK